MERPNEDLGERRMREGQGATKEIGRDREEQKKKKLREGVGGR